MICQWWEIRLRMQQASGYDIGKALLINYKWYKYYPNSALCNIINVFLLSMYNGQKKKNRKFTWIMIIYWSIGGPCLLTVFNGFMSCICPLCVNGVWQPVKASPIRHKKVIMLFNSRRRRGIESFPDVNRSDTNLAPSSNHISSLIYLASLAKLWI